MNTIRIAAMLVLVALVAACAGQQDKWNQRLDWAQTTITVAKGGLTIYSSLKMCGPENPSKVCQQPGAVEEATKAVESAQLAVKLSRDVVNNVYSDASDRDKAIASAISAGATMVAIGAKYGIFE